MKKSGIVILGIMVSMHIFSYAEAQNSGVFFETGTFEQTLTKVKSNKKGPGIIFLDCYTSWCGPCKYMSEKIFTQEQMGKFFNQNFINIKIDMEKGEGVEIAKKYDIQAYPTFLILDSDGNEINRIVGGGDADSFIKRIKKAMDPSNNPKVIKAKFDSYPNLDNAIAYLESLKESNFNKEIETFLEEIFAVMPPRDRYSERMWPYISQSLQDANSKIFEWVLSEKYLVDRIAYKERVDICICSSIKRLVANYTTGRIKDADHNAIMVKVKYLSLLSDGWDETTSYFVNVPKYFGENHMDAIVAMLNVGDLMKKSENDRNTIERLLMSVKDFPKAKQEEYLKAKQDYLQKQIAQIKI